MARRQGCQTRSGRYKSVADVRLLLVMVGLDLIVVFAWRQAALWEPTIITRYSMTAVLVAVTALVIAWWLVWFQRIKNRLQSLASEPQKMRNFPHWVEVLSRLVPSEYRDAFVGDIVEDESAGGMKGHPGWLAKLYIVNEFFVAGIYFIPYRTMVLMKKPTLRIWKS